MSLHVTIDLPQELEERLRSGDLAADVREAVLLHLFRTGRITHVELAGVLGLDRHDTDAWLKHRHVFEGSLTMADLAADEQTLKRVWGKAG
jgi:hypothetical protein